jgi:hypothetical protein
MNLDTLVNVSRLFIPIIAFIGMYIAWQQFTANREKIRFELYDKRFAIYTTVFKFVDTILWSDWDSITEEYLKFDIACHEAEFILPESINIELRKLNRLVKSWRRVSREVNTLTQKNLPIDEPKVELCGIESDLEDMIPIIQTAFMKVLKFEKF